MVLRKDRHFVLCLLVAQVVASHSLVVGSGPPRTPWVMMVFQHLEVGTRYYHNQALRFPLSRH